MPQAKLTIGELEAGYPMYCKALRRLLQQGKTAQDIERTVCWGHLETLNRCLPTRYKSPSYLLALIPAIWKSLRKPETDQLRGFPYITRRTLHFQAKNTVKPG